VDEVPLRLRVWNIRWSDNCTTARVTWEANKPVTAYYYRLYQTTSAYQRTTLTYADFEHLTEGYYLVVVTARDTEGALASEPCRVWFYNRPLGSAFQVYIERYTLVDTDAFFYLAANRDVAAYYVRLYTLEDTYFRSDGSAAYPDLTHGLYYFVATGRELGTASFPPGGPARQFFYINAVGF